MATIINKRKVIGDRFKEVIASMVSFNPTSTLTSTTAQAAIEEVDSKVENIELTAEKVSFDDTTSQTGSSNVQGAIDSCFQSVSSGKTSIASAITDKGIETSSDATFAIMAANIASIATGHTAWTMVLNVTIDLYLQYHNQKTYQMTIKYADGEFKTFSPTYFASVDCGATSYVWNANCTISLASFQWDD